jgi:CubicO group peptidase (beta-lactamase class C family)
MPSRRLGPTERRDAAHAYFSWLEWQAHTVGIPGICAAIRMGGKNTYALAVDTTGGPNPMQIDDRLHAASVTKFPAALTANRLSQMGLLDLHAPIGPYVYKWLRHRHDVNRTISRPRRYELPYGSGGSEEPPFVQEPRRAGALSQVPYPWITTELAYEVLGSSLRDRTIFEFLSHTGDIARNGRSGDQFTGAPGPDEHEMLMDFVRPENDIRNHLLGRKIQKYSNTGAAFVVMSMEGQMNMRWPDLAHQYVLGPLGMTSSGFHAATITRPHHRSPLGKDRGKLFPKSALGDGTGLRSWSLITNVTDLALLGSPLTSSFHNAAGDFPFTSQDRERFTARLNDDTYSLGFGTQIYRQDGRDLVGFIGQYLGHHCGFLVDQEEDIVVSVMLDCDEKAWNYLLAAFRFFEIARSLPEQGASLADASAARTARMNMSGCWSHGIEPQQIFAIGDEVRSVALEPRAIPETLSTLRHIQDQQWRIQPDGRNLPDSMSTPSVGEITEALDTGHLRWGGYTFSERPRTPAVVSGLNAGRESTGLQIQ